jgi:peptidoglycan/LPS O-acetylase OafA/YrhL
MFVVFSHLSFLENSSNYFKKIYLFFSEGGRGVTFFFILTGFILAFSYYEKLEKNIKKEFLHSESSTDISATYNSIINFITYKNFKDYR